MKKLVIACMLWLSGCASLHQDIDTSSKCKYNIDGLSCTREQVWQMQDNGGQTFEADHTKIWFESHSDCKKFVKDKKNRELLDSSDTGYIRNCGVDGSTGSAPSVYNYYIYSDGVKDGDFYYKLQTGYSIAVDRNKHELVTPYIEEEGFVPMFTSRSAFETFKRETVDITDFDDVYIPRIIKRIKIKRMY